MTDRFVAPISDIEIVKKAAEKETAADACSECGAPATHVVCDWRKISTPGLRGFFEIYGQVRYGCPAHPQQSRVYDAEGRLLESD